METEWEATFWPIEKDEVRVRLKAAGAVQIYPERLMRRVNLYLPESVTVQGFVRVRDEGDRITLSVKDTSGKTIESQKEVQVVIDDFERGRALLRALGCKDKNYQETRRELWQLDGADITIDEWPHLEPLVEIEGPSEEVVRAVSTKLGFDWASARFCSADKLYSDRYGIDHAVVNKQTPRLVFDMPNPFQKRG